MQVLAGRPLNGRERGVHVLNLMKGLSPNLHENLVELWDIVIPKLVQYLEGTSPLIMILFIKHLKCKKGNWRLELS